MERSTREKAAQGKFIILYDTAKKCLLIIDHLFSDLENGTRLAADFASIKDSESIIIGLYISALGLVDYFHRFYQIVQAMPLLNKKLPELRKLGKLMAPVTDCRNYLQHIRSKLSEHEQVKYPILGAISWVNDGHNCTLFAGQPTALYQLASITYDRILQRYVCQYQLAVGGHEIHIDSVYLELKSFWSWLGEHTVINPAEIKTYTWGTPNIVESWFSTEPLQNQEDLEHGPL
jgi:hypothetical protein